MVLCRASHAWQTSRMPEDCDTSEAARMTTWLSHVALNVLRDEVRFNLASKRDARLEALGGLDAARDVEAARDLEAARDVDLNELLGHLPGALRLVVAEHFLRGLTYREISEMHGLSLGTICRSIREALDLLRDPRLGLVNDA